MSEMKNFITYYRVSTAKQGNSGLGLAAQRTAVNNYLKSVGEHRVLASFTEVESGKNSDRPEFNKALELVKKENAILLVAKLDRLSRDLHFISGVQKMKVDFVACDMPHANKLTVHIMAAIAEQEREAISSRIKGALAESDKLLGMANPKIREAWLAKGKEKSLATRRRRNKRAYEKLRGKFQELKDMGLSQRKMVEMLNRWEVRTIKGGLWDQSQVCRCLKRLEIE